MRLLPAAVLLVMLGLGSGARSQDPVTRDPDAVEIETAFADLVAATHWRQRNAARDDLASFGEKALATVLRGTRHERSEVRATCQEILREHFPTDDRAVDGILLGLEDESPQIAYASAFHVGQHRIARGLPALREVIADERTDARTRWAAAKSLGELGAKDVMVMLWQGLGSDDAYERYLSNLGVKGLSGKALADFGYEGPWEGAFVSGPVVGRSKGQPIEKAEKRVHRWQAIVAFTKWLRAAKPKLFAELAEKLW